MFIILLGFTCKYVMSVIQLDWNMNKNNDGATILFHFDWASPMIQEYMHDENIVQAHLISEITLFVPLNPYGMEGYCLK